MSQWSARGGQETSRRDSRKTRRLRHYQNRRAKTPQTSAQSDLGRSALFCSKQTAVAYFLRAESRCLKRSNSEKRRLALSLLTP
jgi:hypothetical protein